MSFGRGLYGLEPFGSPVLGVAVLGAAAWSTREIRVTLSAEPRHSSAAADGDALNPVTWTVRRLDDGSEFTVIGAAMVDPSTVSLLLFEALGPFQVQHSVATTTLLSLSGEVVTAPESAVFRGVVDRGLATPQAQAATRRFGQRDIANQPTRTDAVGGTLQVAGGDYRNEEGVALVKKLVVRRLVIRPGELFYAPDYGLGIAEKEPLPGSLVGLRTEAERQIAQEPDVESVRVGLTLDAQGTLTVQVAAKVRQTGQDVRVSYVANPGDR